jgi:hypothetical protein
MRINIKYKYKLSDFSTSNHSRSINSSTRTYLIKNQHKEDNHAFKYDRETYKLDRIKVGEMRAGRGRRTASSADLGFLLERERGGRNC